jgi:hypothetical protein
VVWIATQHSPARGSRSAALGSAPSPARTPRISARLREQTTFGQRAATAANGQLRRRRSSPVGLDGLVAVLAQHLLQASCPGAELRAELGSRPLDRRAHNRPLGARRGSHKQDGEKSVIARRNADRELARCLPVELRGPAGAWAAATRRAPVLDLQEAEPGQLVQVVGRKRSTHSGRRRALVAADRTLPLAHDSQKGVAVAARPGR